MDDVDGHLADAMLIMGLFPEATPFRFQVRSADKKRTIVLPRDMPREELEQKMPDYMRQYVNFI